MAYGWFQVVTNYRTFLIEAAGIGDAIDRALSVIVGDRGEYLREIAATDAPAMEIAA